MVVVASLECEGFPVIIITQAEIIMIHPGLPHLAVVPFALSHLEIQKQLTSILKNNKK